MHISLFEHNEKAYKSALKTLKIAGKAAIIHPTGSGKSFIAFKLCEDNPEKTICWLSPSEYIFKTQLENLSAVTNGYVPDNITFFTYAKIGNLTDAETAEIKPDYIVLDEFHRCGASEWGKGVKKLLSAYDKTPVLGLSTTAIRYLDNQRDMAEELFDGNVASEITLGEAIVNGILNPPTYVLALYSYGNDLINYKHRIAKTKNRAVRDKAEKYYESLRRALEKSVGLDVIFQRYLPAKHGKYIVFCTNMDHMREMMAKVPEWFGKIDDNPCVYSVYSKDPTTDKTFAEFKENNEDRLKLLFCIDMLNEGVHVDKIDGVILFRPTVSPIIYKQQIGRALSASSVGKTVIIDAVDNIENLYGIGAIEKEMQIAVNYYRFFGENKKIVNERFKVVDELQDVRSIFDKLNETLSASWDTMFDLAKDYYEKNGNLEIKRKYKTNDGYALGQWVFTQRDVYKGETYGTLDKDRIRKLEDIGMVWDSPRDISYRRYYDAAKTYYAIHGDLNVPKNFAKSNGVDLAAWIRRIRSYRKHGIERSYLTDERIAELDKMGMVWDVPDYLWEENFSGAEDFYKKNGHLDIPANYRAFNGLKVGGWIRRQRALRNGKITDGVPPTDEQIAKLDSIGMIWKNKFEVAWENGYNALLSYFNEHGNVDVPFTYVTPNGYKLGAWVSDRREKGKRKHTLARQKQLDSLGFVWEKPDPWETRYKLAETYYGKHGNLNIPSNYKANGVWLAKWLYEQRQIYAGNRKNEKLTDEQIKKLEDVGINWNIRGHGAKKRRGNPTTDVSETIEEIALTNSETYKSNEKIIGKEK